MLCLGLKIHNFRKAQLYGNKLGYFLKQSDENND